MESIFQDIQEYVTPDGRNDFREWLTSVTDKVLSTVVLKRIYRLALGNFGDCKSLGGGLFELRIHYGAGYRIYFGRRGRKIVILLCGGDKMTQPWDIRKAKIYWGKIKEEK